MSTHPLEDENRRLREALGELEAQRDQLAVSEARYASLQNRDEALNVAKTLARSLAQTCEKLRNHSDLLKQIVNAETAYYRDYHISNARAALAAEPASGEASFRPSTRQRGGGG